MLPRISKKRTGLRPLESDGRPLRIMLIIRRNQPPRLNKRLEIPTQSRNPLSRHHPIPHQPLHHPPINHHHRHQTVISPGPTIAATHHFILPPLKTWATQSLVHGQPAVRQQIARGDRQLMGPRTPCRDREHAISCPRPPFNVRGPHSLPSVWGISRGSDRVARRPQAKGLGTVPKSPATSDVTAASSSGSA